MHLILVAFVGHASNAENPQKGLSEELPAA
jgi:hypothetical protein